MRPVSASLAAMPPACGSLPTFDRPTAEAIMAGWLTISPFPRVAIDPQGNGDVDWRLDPFHHPTWVSDFQSGGWIEMLVSGYLAGGSRAEAYRARAEVLTRSWLRGVPPADRDPGTLICISTAFPGQKWIQDQIRPAVDYYAAHWQGAWNHGLKQDLELLRIGCGYPATAFGGAALRWRQTAVNQMIASFAPNTLGPAIDAQGAVNEQATGYAAFIYQLWGRALPQLAACGYQLPGWIMGRIALLPAFLRAATQPDGNLVQIGDTYLERGLTTPAQAQAPAVAVYSRGYIFGRSGTGPGASYYALRFGGARQVHGHEDHMGLVYFARGRDLIVNAGHTGYETGAYRSFLRSPDASSVLVMPGEDFSGAAETQLVSDRIGPYGQFYEFFDTAFGGHPRYRSVYVDFSPDLVVVYDRASGAAAYTQLWHLDPVLTVTSISRTAAVASAPGTQLELLQVPLPGQVIPAGSTQVVSGQVNPFQGWVSRQMLQRTPADVVTMTRTGPSAAMLTLIVPAAPGTPVAAAIHGPASGPWTLTARIGAATVTLALTAQGQIGGG